MADEPEKEPSKPRSRLLGDGPGLAPSNSTNASILGAFVATTFIIICHNKGIDFPAGYEASMAGAVTILFGYIPKSGRK